MQNNILMPGDSAGNYDKKWTETFDLKFVILWFILFLILLLKSYKQPFSQFANLKEFWSAMILFPPIMTLSEAFAPHSMDTPIMMLIGFSLLFGICYIF